MKNIFNLVLVLLLSLCLYSCEDNDLKIELSEETTLTSVDLVEITEGVKIKFSDKTINLFLSRGCPSEILLNAELPLGAKIIEVSDGLELKTDSTFIVPLVISEFTFVIQAENLENTQTYKVNILKDKIDLALHIIEQIFQKDGAFVWNHKKDDSGNVIESKLVNVDNDKNYKVYKHELDKQGFITKTSYTSVLHKKYNYVWKYDNKILASYDKQLFNQLPSHHLISFNSNNLVTKIIEKNDFDYVVNETLFKYDAQNRISEMSDVKLSFKYTYLYDGKNRGVSSGKYDYDFDNYGNIVKKTPVGNGSNYVYEYLYNGDGTISKETTSREGWSPTICVYFYFGNGTISRKEQETTVWEYQEDGSYTYNYGDANSVIEANEKYDVSHNLLEKQKDQRSPQNPYYNYKYTEGYEYDEVGNVLRLTHVVDNKDTTPTKTTIIDYEYNNYHLLVKRTYTVEGVFDKYNLREYDANGFVIESAYYRPNSEKIHTYTYSFDAFGKRKSKKIENFTTGLVNAYTWGYFPNWTSKLDTWTRIMNGVVEYEEKSFYDEIGAYLIRKESKQYDNNGALQFFTVIEYYENGNWSSRIVYDGEGNVISSETNQPGENLPFIREFDENFESVL